MNRLWMDVINWREWNPFNFEKALREQKPVLLSISATWCHWCHVMDQSTFAKPAVIELVNSRFVPIRIDTDRRPDINARYNAGGWPTAAILDGNGIPLNQTLYQNETGFLDFLQTSLTAFSELKTVSPLANHTHFGNEPPVLPDKPLSRDDYAVVETKTIQKLKQLFDPHQGGFGHHAKFPHVSALRYLVSKTETVSDPDLEAMLVRTLDAIQNRGLRDHTSQGFFRYTTTREWSVPHYEKMLEDNLGLCEMFARASTRFHRVDYLQTAWQTMHFVETRLKDPVTGLFNGSQDADEAYYQKPPAERNTLAPPGVDESVYADWNCLAVGAYLSLNRLLDAQQHLEKLAQAAYSDGTVHHLIGDASSPALLKDHAWLLRAMLSCHTARTGDWRTQSIELANAIDERFFDDPQQAYKDVASDPKQVGLLLNPQHPLPENSLMIENLLLLDRIDPEGPWKETALRVFGRFYTEFESYGIFAAPYAWDAFVLRKNG